MRAQIPASRAPGGTQNGYGSTQTSQLGPKRDLGRGAEALAAYRQERRRVTEFKGLVGHTGGITSGFRRRFSEIFIDFKGLFKGFS